MNRIEIVQGDITKIKADAIVNAANTSLLGGGGVDGAIHRAAGPELLAECRTLNGCPTGEARLTRGYRLPARYVIHTPGPVWHGGQQQEHVALTSCYRNCLTLAIQHGIRTIAFPAISTGGNGYPIAEACRIALAETGRFLAHHPEVEKVVFVCFGRDAFMAYQETLRAMQAHGTDAPNHEPGAP